MLTSTRAVLLSALQTLLKGPSTLLHTIFVLWLSPLFPPWNHSQQLDSFSRTLHHFVAEVEQSFGARTEPIPLLSLSLAIHRQLKEALLSNPRCMLPSYNHQLPTGHERGRFLALDVGGSTLRIALIDLQGAGDERTRVIRKRAWKVDRVARELQGEEFFDWIAAKIDEVVGLEGGNLLAESLAMGLSWSFPIEQTSLRSGLLQEMGKGFRAAQDLIGQDLGDLLQAACQRRGLGVELHAIVNDSSASLLSKAYTDPSTRFALILGTGVNAAVHLPVDIFGPKKFGARPTSWHEQARHVLVNTELSMFGRGILPLTRWDDAINEAHSAPEFQPFEHLVGGGYLGELVRLVLVEAIETAGLFNGTVPPSLETSYSLDTETISHIEADETPDLHTARDLFATLHPSATPPSHNDILTLRTIATHVTKRASALLAAACHALWLLRAEAEGLEPCAVEPIGISYNGSVIERYPKFRANCQMFLDGLVESSGGRSGALELTPAVESSLVGAAVAVACLHLA